MLKKNIIVGLFVLAGVVLFTTGLYFIGSRDKAFDKHIDYYTGFANLSGLTKGAKVRVAGMEAGEVVSIAVPDSPASPFRIDLRVESKLKGLIRTDSQVTIETEGVVGDTYLLIHAGTARQPVAPASFTLASKEPIELSALLEKGSGLMTDADTTIKQLGGQLQGTVGEVQTTVGHVDGVVRNVNDVVTGIKQGRGAVGLLLRNQQFSDQVQQTVTTAQQTVGNLDQASLKADQLIADLESRKLPQKVDQSMDHIRSASAHIDSSAAQLDQTLKEATAPDSQGVDAGTNLSQALTSANVATANLAEDTEALKHEFFFRGLFRHQGYYNLGDLSAATYRSDKVFANSANRRIWLSSAQLFEAAPDGTEELSLAGEQALDQAIGSLGEQAVHGPIVVEGYSDSADPAARIASSRRRAILAERYLQKHFQILPDKIGFAALEATPPAGAGRARWDGECIVLLTQKK